MATQVMVMRTPRVSKQGICPREKVTRGIEVAGCLIQATKNMGHQWIWSVTSLKLSNLWKKYTFYINYAPFTSFLPADCITESCPRMVNTKVGVTLVLLVLSCFQCECVREAHLDPCFVTSNCDSYKGKTEGFFPALKRMREGLEREKN